MASTPQAANLPGLRVVIAGDGQGRPTPFDERSTEWGMRSGRRSRLGQHNAVIMAVLCLVIGAKLVGDAISGFSG